MLKVKFRVIEEKFCRACKVVHEFPKRRYLYYQPDIEGDEHGLIQAGHAWALDLLNSENKDRRVPLKQRPWFQYVIPLRGRHG